MKPASPTTGAVGVVLVLVLVAPLSTAPATAGADRTDARITNVAYSGTGSVAIRGDDLVLWRAMAHEFTVTVYTRARVTASACLVHGPGRTIACEPVDAEGDRLVTVPLGVDRWPADLVGAQNLSVVLRADAGDEPIARKFVELTVIRASGDLDDDGLANEREAALGTGLRTMDTDGDGLSDGLEIGTYETSPTRRDSDGDTLADAAEVHTHGTDPTTVDTDSDGLPDHHELARSTNPTRPDSDGDGQADGAEVNVHGTDPGDPDTDGDGLDDDAEIAEHETNPLRPDTDDDGLTDNLEVDTYRTDPTRVDTDADGLVDGREVFTHQTDPADADSDGDGLADGQEVNTYGTNPTAADTDGDGLADGAEVNRYGTNPSAVDTDNDGTSDAQAVGTRAGLAVTPTVVGGVGLLAVGIVGLLVWYRSAGSVALPRRPIPWSPSPDAGAEPIETEPANQSTAGSTGSDDPVPPELLSNQDRIRQLLADHDGRMRQAAVVEQTDWSKSKVSRVLAKMEADGEIVKIDVGRGNVIARPDAVPAGAMTPFES